MASTLYSFADQRAPPHKKELFKSADRGSTPFDKCKHNLRFIPWKSMILSVIFQLKPHLWHYILLKYVFSTGWSDIVNFKHWDQFNVGLHDVSGRSSWSYDELQSKHWLVALVLSYSADILELYCFILWEWKAV